MMTTRKLHTNLVGRKLRVIDENDLDVEFVQHVKELRKSADAYTERTGQPLAPKIPPRDVHARSWLGPVYADRKGQTGEIVTVREVDGSIMVGVLWKDGKTDEFYFPMQTYRVV
jgi:hypothetical protein